MTEKHWSRRTILGGAVAAATIPAIATPPATAQARRPAPTHAYVGSWTTRERQASGQGISVYRIHGASGRWELQQLVTADNDVRAGVLPSSPSFLTFDRTRRFLYAVHADIAKVSALAVNAGTGDLTYLGSVETGRTNPVFVSVDPSNRWVIVANYDPPGSVITLPIRGDGSLGPLTGDMHFPGKPGPHKVEQLGSYAHFAQFDPSGRWLVVADRGLDSLFVLELNRHTGALSLHEPGTVRLREISGPRHVAFHPTLPYAYSVDELRSCVSTFGWDDERGVFEPVQVLSSTPPSMTGDSRAGEIAVAPSGRFVYASNRSGAGVPDPQHPDDTVGCWRVDPCTGALTPVAWTSTGGLQVRNFALSASGHRLYAANEVSNTVVSFAVDTRTGHLHRIGTVATGSPTCILLK